MKLSEAIIKTINNCGVDILKEQRFISVLSDFQAFEDLKYAKNMLKQIYQNGFGIHIYNAYIAKDITQVGAIKSSIANNLGFDYQKVSEIFDGFDVAFGLSSHSAPTTQYNYTTITQSTQPTYQPPSSNQYFNIPLNVGNNPYQKPQITNPPLNNITVDATHCNCDVYDRPIENDHLSVSNLKYIMLDVRINNNSSFEGNVNLVVQLKTGNVNQVVYQYNIFLKQGFNQFKLPRFGNGDGSYFSTGFSEFTFYIDNEEVGSHRFFVNKNGNLEGSYPLFAKIIVPIIVIALYVCIWFKFEWWAILIYLLSSVCCVFSLHILFDTSRITGDVFFISGFALILLTLLFPFPWWVWLIEVVVYCASLFIIRYPRL